jgi:ribonuclease R
MKVRMKKESNIIVGTLRTNPKGFGFVIPQDNSIEDIFIAKDSMSTAMDGDIVKVELNDVYSSKGPSGHILQIIKRNAETICGIVKNKQKEIYNANLPLKIIQLESSKEHLHIGDILKLKIIDIKKQTIIVEEIGKIGNIFDPSIDIKFAIEEFNLSTSFSEEALNEAATFGEEIIPQDLEGRENFTNITTITIDPDLAKDFDDAISLEKDKKGHFHLGVHIADVAHYVKPSSSLDKEAIKRCNSTYFPNYVLPMLPPSLSNNLCSLKPNVIRLTVSVMMHFNRHGKLLNYKIIRSYIKSHRRFTYKEAFKILKSKDKGPFKELLENMRGLFIILHKQRMQRGSIDFSMPEEVIKVAEDGNPIGIEILPYDISHQIIEEFMLKANELIAIHLSKNKKNSIYRVHEEPSHANFADFFTFARSLGFKLPANPTPKDLNQMFLEAKHTEYAKHFSLNFIKSLKLATYSPENIGHFGLALEYYCHFTSPIRRYTDLIAERLLFDEAQDINLEEIAKISSEKERASAQAENMVSALKKMRFLLAHHEKHPKFIYEATISRVKPFFIYFEISGFLIEGACHVSSLSKDFFIFDDKKVHLRGRSTGKTYKFGNKIKVKIKTFDLISSSIEWQLIE